MLGDKVVQDERGKVVGTRVLPGEGSNPKMEITFQTTLKLLGLAANNTGTVTAVLMSGVFHEAGRGVVMTTDGEVATWAYTGVGKPAGAGGAVAHRGVVLFQTQSPKLARLNGMCTVVAADADAEGNMKAELWEWK